LLIAALGLSESGMKADECAPSAVSNCCSRCYRNVKAKRWFWMQ